MTDEPDDEDDQSGQEETPDQPSPEDPSVDDGETDPANNLGSTDSKEDTGPSDDAEGPNGGTDASGDRPGNDNLEWTWLGVRTAIAMPIVGVLVAIILFAINFDPLDALLIGFAYLSLVTVGAGLYVFTNDSERPIRLLRATGGLAAALLGVSVFVILTMDTDFVQMVPVVSQSVPLFVYVYAVGGALGYVFTVVGEQRLNQSSDSRSEDTTDGSEHEQTRLMHYQPARDLTRADPDETDGPIEPSKIYDWSIRVLAAIPLAAAVFLLASLLLPQSQFGDPEVTVRTAEGVVTVNETGVSDRLNENSSIQNVNIERRQRSDRLLAGLALLTGLFVNTAYIRLNDLAVRLLSGNREGRNDDSE